MPDAYVLPVPEPAAEETISFLSLVNFVLRNVVLLVGMGALVATVLAVRRAASPETYTATALFSTGEEQALGSLFGLSILAGNTARSPYFYTDLVKSPAVLGSVVESKFQIKGLPQPVTLIQYFGGGASSPQAAKEAAMGAVASRIQTKVSPATNVITMNVRASEPRLASAMARRILVGIDEFNSRNKKAQISADREFSEGRLLEIEADVRASEDRLRVFLERNREISLSPALSLAKERLADDVAARRTLYNTVLVAFERAKMEEMRENRLVTIINEPTPPLQPDSKGIARLAFLGFFAGFLLGMALALWKEYMGRVSGQSSPESKEFARLRANAATMIVRPLRRSSGAN